MRVSFRITGGYAATLRRPETVIDAEALSPAERDRLDALLARARAEPPPPPRRRPDAMTYVVEVQDEAGSSVLQGSDGDMTPAFAELLAWVRRQGGQPAPAR